MDVAQSNLWQLSMAQVTGVQLQSQEYSSSHRGGSLPSQGCSSRHRDVAPVTRMQFQSQGWLSAVTGMQFPSQGYSSSHRGGSLPSQGCSSRHRDGAPITRVELPSQGCSSRHRSGESIFQKPFMAVAGWRNYIVGCTDRARFILPG